MAEWDYALGTNDPDLRAFKASGGKVIIWHGFMDPLIFSYGTTDYYQRVVGVMPGDNFKEKLDATRKFARLFMAPNVGHCGGRTGPTPVSPFDRLVDWVEDGKAPDTLSCTAGPQHRGQPVRQADDARSVHVAGRAEVQGRPHHGR